MLLQIPTTIFSLASKTPPINPLCNLLTKTLETQPSTFEQTYRNACNLLVSLTQSRSLIKGQKLHAQIIKSRLDIVPLLSNQLINFYSKCQLPHDSRKIFDDNPRQSPTSWSSIISTFAQNELPQFSLEFFRRMLEYGVRPDDHIFPSAAKSCAILSRLDVGQSVHCLAVKTGYGVDLFVGSSLVDMYAKCGGIIWARQMFDEMPDKNVVSWTGMINGYAQLGDNEESLRLFKQALVEHLDVNDFTFTSVIRVCATLTLLELGRQIHGLCLKTSFDSSSFVGSSLISLYSKCGVVEGAYMVFDELPVKNLGAWNSMMMACAQHSQVQKAFELLSEMERSGIRPNFISFLCVLLGCSHAGMVEKGQFYFNMMKKRGIEPGTQNYACLVDLLSRAGKLKEALSVIEEMSMEPTESVWGALLTGSRIHGDTEMAAFAADKVFNLGTVSPGMHVQLSNAYASAGKWLEAAEARKMLRDRGTKKETGLSWMEEGGRSHTFAAGDRSHVRSADIYQKLEELGEEMEKAGYVPDTSFVFKEVDSEEKKQTIGYHSERLAIAFGLITLPPGRPIRIMKNLRVCGDCHTAIKFMSKCTGRTIIVRDNNRFHTFKDGVCSCGNYW
ncbi:putative pentatricopeptide repeat-containing protein At5g52630 [Papaver somniferum]|uniref:putative pentatricopeptide repeat-containing protein At5g52630 n=1 Tax=Papaver somniferum TaxID=3469 RepID=UPI000E6F6C0C|nr:putative pentatricopeptide repeat-containing protein At5g52630 [Papaver somniferum]